MMSGVHIRRAVAISVVLLAGLVQCLPARAEQATAAETLYYNALASMHAVPDAPYLEFDYQRDQNVSGSIRHEIWHVVERTQDGRMHFSSPSAGDSAGDAHFVVRPDLFLKPPPVNVVQQQFTVATDLPVIGTVTARTTHYDIALAGQNDTADCPGATHLHLTPKPQADPFRYNLREIWVASDNHVCEAKAVWNAGNYYGHQFPVEITLYVASRSGLVDRWTAEGVARMGPFHSEYQVKSSYAELTTSKDEPAKLFER